MTETIYPLGDTMRELTRAYKEHNRDDVEFWTVELVLSALASLKEVRAIPHGRARPKTTRTFD